MGFGEFNTLYYQKKFGCGFWESYIFVEQSGISWFAGFLNRTENANPLMVSRMITPNSGEIWVDNNRDGVFDEHYDDARLFSQKYTFSPCDAVK